MRTLSWGVVPWALMAQAPPLTYSDLQKNALQAPEQYRTEALLATGRRTLSGSAGLLREGPSMALAAGPRTRTLGPSTTDSSFDVDLPLFLDRGVRRRLEAALGKADPVLRRSARVEAAYQLRLAYLQAWLDQERLRLRESDLATAQAWLKAARARQEAGADPAFQATLVEGEILKARMDQVEAQRQRALSWNLLRALTPLPLEPQPLADPGEPAMPAEAGLAQRFAQGALRQALACRLELDQGTLQHQEALASSRWSFRGSYGREGEERIAKAGFAYRFSRPGESRALRQETQAGLAAAQREMEVAKAGLEARFQAALSSLRSYPSQAPRPASAEAIAAVGLRLEEGKERPSEALPIRRQLLESQLNDLMRRQTGHALLAELEALTEPGAPTPQGARP